MSHQILKADFENPLVGIENDSVALNGSIVNGAEETPRSLTVNEVVMLLVIGLLGVAGILMNSAVLAVVYKGGLVKRDHRMLYYIFMTIGDLMLALHAFFSVFNYVYRNVYVLKIFAVCFNIQLILGIASYQWSAICIILLIVDLTWCVKSPYRKVEHKKLFAKVSCIGTFFLGIAMTVAPFLYWNDSPAELVYCSIANVYGVHFEFFQQEVVAFLSTMLLCLFAACLNLLLAVCRIHKSTFSQEKPTTSRNPATFQPRVKTPETSITKTVETSEISMQCEIKDGRPIKPSHPVFAIDEENERAKTGMPKKKLTLGGVNESKHIKNRNNEDSSYTQADARRQRFIRSCLTVGIFTASYVGCCMPYYVLSWLNISCHPNCSEETPESRRIRVIASSAVYLLPIIDPILYIKRFKLFNDTLLILFRRLRSFCCTRL